MCLASGGAFEDVIRLQNHFLNVAEMGLRLPVGANQLKVIGEALDGAQRLA
jgi:hypothetical protein